MRHISSDLNNKINKRILYNIKYNRIIVSKYLLIVLKDWMRMRQ